jgi:hypothetical protein
MFRAAPVFEVKHLEAVFRHKFKMLLSKEKITQDIVEMHMNWRHSGFNVFCGPRIQPTDETANRLPRVLTTHVSRKDGSN